MSDVQYFDFRGIRVSGTEPKSYGIQFQNDLRVNPNRNEYEMVGETTITLTCEFDYAPDSKRVFAQIVRGLCEQYKFRFTGTVSESVTDCKSEYTAVMMAYRGHAELFRTLNDPVREGRRAPPTEPAALTSGSVPMLRDGKDNSEDE